MKASRSTVSFTSDNWSKLLKVPNKSLLVNKALEFYFSAQDHVKKAEADFIMKEIAHYESTGESYSHEETFKP